MAGTLNTNELIPDQGQTLYINTAQYGSSLVIGNSSNQLVTFDQNGNLNVASNGYIKVAVGTTAQRPSNPQVGYLRFNTDTGVLENYTANGWFKVSVLQPTISGITGTIYSGNVSTLIITGSNFGSSNATVTFSGAKIGRAHV